MKQSPILFSLFGNDYFAKSLHQALGYDLGNITLHQFPDEETVIKIDSLVQDSEIIFIANLEHPNSKLLPLLFAAETARELGAKKIGLIINAILNLPLNQHFKLKWRIAHFFVDTYTNCMRKNLSCDSIC